MQQISVTHRAIMKVKEEKIIAANDMLAIEEPLEIQIIYGPTGSVVQKSISITMRTPGNDEELAIGFLFTEGIIGAKEQIASVKCLQFKNHVQVTLHPDQKPNLPGTERNFYTTSSCGICGKSSIDAIRTVSLFTETAQDLFVNAGVFYHLEEAVRFEQDVFRNTGGLHASALFDLQGKFLDLREDVGRHNALDKMIGSAFLKVQLPLYNTILLLSGRASFELIQKAVMAGIKIIAAIGAPSSLAVELAEEHNITLIGFLKKDRFNIYCGSERVVFN